MYVTDVNFRDLAGLGSRLYSVFLFDIVCRARLVRCS